MIELPDPVLHASGASRPPEEVLVQRADERSVAPAAGAGRRHRGCRLRFGPGPALLDASTVIECWSPFTRPVTVIGLCAAEEVVAVPGCVVSVAVTR